MPYKGLEKYLKQFGRSWQGYIDAIPRFTAIVSKPQEECYATEFNQFKGLNYELDFTKLAAEEREKISTFITHFTRVWTSDADSTQHLINFCGMKLKYPFDSVPLDRMEQYVVLLGEQGSGKFMPLKRSLLDEDVWSRPSAVHKARPPNCQVQQSAEGQAHCSD